MLYLHSKWNVDNYVPVLRLSLFMHIKIITKDQIFISDQKLRNENWKLQFHKNCSSEDFTLSHIRAFVCSNLLIFAFKSFKKEWKSMEKALKSFSICPEGQKIFLNPIWPPLLRDYVAMISHYVPKFERVWFNISQDIEKSFFLHFIQSKNAE